MFATITVKLEAETKAELLNTFPSQYQQIRAHITELKNKGIFGPPSKIDLRWLVVGSVIRVPEETAEVILEAVEQTAPPRDLYAE